MKRATPDTASICTVSGIFLYVLLHCLVGTLYLVCLWLMITSSWHVNVTTGTAIHQQPRKACQLMGIPVGSPTGQEISALSLSKKRLVSNYSVLCIFLYKLKIN